LAYSLNAAEQPPPFLLGSMGYMSPEQRAMDKPTTAQDVFAIGGLLIKIFTGLSPAQFEQSDDSGLTEQLHYFIKNKTWAQAITACRKSDPSCRPELALVKGQLSNFRLETLHHSAGTGLGEIKLNTRLNLTTTIYAALGSFLNTVFNSPPHDAGKSFVNGMPGIVYVLCRADLNGFRTKELQAFVDDYLPVFQEEILRGPALIAPGLINGSSGMAIMVKLLYEAKFFSINHASSDQLHELLLTLPDTKLPLSDGLAGHGLAILQCFSLIDARIGLRLLNEISHRLVRLQQEDGSWRIQNESDELLAVKNPGLFYGTAGIVYFLIQYASQFKNNQAKEAAIKGLQYLIDCRVLYDDHFVWRLHPHAAIDPWLENGFSGIALVFITGYAHFQDQRYKAVAENALRKHPRLISSESLDLLNGLAGLGEVYLEAFKVFGETEWDERATHIAAFLCHTGTKNSVGNKYWYTGKSERTDGSLLNGHAGIIHFLMRYLKPTEIQFPIINGSCTT